MDLTKKQQQAQEVINNIISKCWEDENFKAQLVANPVKTIEAFTGRPANVPEGKRLVVVDQSNDSNAVYFNIPKKLDVDEMELTDEQLEQVAGGGLIAGITIGLLLIHVLVDLS